MLQFRRTTKEDADAIISFLSKFNLPTDVAEHLQHFILAEDNGKVIGCIGIELHGKEGLLRSLAVDEAYRNKSIAKQLVRNLQSYAYNAGVENLHLLTETAKDYFKKAGFRITERSEAPEEIKSTLEFTTLCASNSSYMVKRNINTSAAYFRSGLHSLKTDAETESNYWSVKSVRMMFTRFIVPAGKTFSRHSHESEQMTYVLEGKLFFEIDGEVYGVERDDFIFIPSNKEHKVWTEAEAAVAIDAWSPGTDKY